MTSRSPDRCAINSSPGTLAAQIDPPPIAIAPERPRPETLSETAPVSEVDTDTRPTLGSASQTAPAPARSRRASSRRPRAASGPAQADELARGDRRCSSVPRPSSTNLSDEPVAATSEPATDTAATPNRRRGDENPTIHGGRRPGRYERRIVVEDLALQRLQLGPGSRPSSSTGASGPPERRRAPRPDDPHGRARA